MSVAIKITGVTPKNGQGYLVGEGPFDRTNNGWIVDCLLTLSGNYGGAATHGDTINFAAATGIGIGPLGDNAPTMWEFHELVAAGTALPGFEYEYCPGPSLAAPTLNAGVLNIRGAGAGSGQGGTEITEGGAYAGTTPSLNNQVIKARFWFSRD